jgi:NitT/TauT family transport system substrate-binding protein
MLLFCWGGRSMSIRLMMSAALLVLSACAPPAPAPPPPTPTASVARAANAAYAPAAPLNPPVKVTAIDGGIVANVPLYEGIDKGYYAAEGIDLTLAPLSDASTSAQMIATNQAQFYIAVPDPVIFNALSRGVAVRILVSSTTNSPTDRPAALMVRQDLIDSGRYKTATDLKGMTIAAGAQSAQFYVSRALAKGGLTLADAKVVNVGGLPDEITAMQNKSVDAAWEVEPLITGAERQGLARAVFGTGELCPGAVGAALIMSPSFEKDNPEAAVRFLVAYLRGQRDYFHAINKKDADPSAVIGALTAHTLVKDPKLYQVMGVPSLDPNGTMDASTWDPFQDFYVSSGILEHKLDLSQYMDTQLVNAALDRLGRE